MSVSGAIRCMAAYLAAKTFDNSGFKFKLDGRASTPSDGGDAAYHDRETGCRIRFEAERGDKDINQYVREYIKAEIQDSKSGKFFCIVCNHDTPVTEPPTPIPLADAKCRSVLYQDLDGSVKEHAAYAGLPVVDVAVKIINYVREKPHPHICGKYGTRSTDGGKTWVCQGHDK